MKEYAFSKYRRRELRQAVKRADKDIFDDLIRFLVDDPRTFGSGYKKEMIWKYIKRYHLRKSDISRLEEAAFQYLSRPMSREFKFMCQTMSRIATSGFWQQVESALESDNPVVQINAYCLYAYSDGITSGEKRRLELKHLKRQIRWEYVRKIGGRWTFYSVDDLLSLLHEPENWPDGKVLYREPNPDDLPIYYFNPSRDKDFASLNLASGNTEIILSKLSQVLSTGAMHIFSYTAWLYTIYLLRQIDDPGAVPILVTFLKDKIDYKFKSPSKRMLEGTTLKVLRYFGTPEAMKVVWNHQEADQEYSQYYAQMSHGWVLSYPSIDDE